MIKNHPGEIKVASGEMVENVSGGARRSFSGGSHGTVDERRPSDHESGVSETGQSRPGDEPMDTESGRKRSDGNVAELLNQRQYDHNPRVADYESPEEVMELWLNS
jgi:hypothetical protein